MKRSVPVENNDVEVDAKKPRGKSGPASSANKSRPRFELYSSILYEQAPTVIMQESQVDCMHNYNTLYCQEIVQKQNKFIESYSTPTSVHCKHSTCVFNCITGEVINIANEHLTLASLKEHFDGIGHALAIPMSHNYSFKVCFDFDYKNTAATATALDQSTSSPPQHQHQHQHQHQAAAVVEIPNTQLSMLYGDVTRLLSSHFPRLGFVESNGFVMTRGRNVHIYYNIDVSIVVYNIMVNVLTNLLDETYTSVYKVDRVDKLPLPYSAKSDRNAYVMRSPLTTVADSQLSASSSSSLHSTSFCKPDRFYDYSWYQQKTTLSTDCKPLLDYESRPMNTTATLKAINKHNRVYMVLSDMENNKIVQVAKHPTLLDAICKLKLESIRSVQSNYQLLDYVVTLRNELRLNKRVELFSVPPSIENSQDWTRKYESIHYSLKPLNRYLAESLYFTSSDDPNNENITYLISALIEHEEYSVYLLIIAFMYCCNDTMSSEDSESIKNNVLDYVSVHLQCENNGGNGGGGSSLGGGGCGSFESEHSHRSNTNTTTLMSIIENMKAYNIMNELSRSFATNYNDLLDYIILEISIKQKSTMQEYISAVIMHVFSLGVVEGGSVEAFELIIKLICFPIKMDFGEDCFIYNYTNKAYEQVTQLKQCNTVRLIQSLMGIGDKMSKSEKEIACTTIIANLKNRHIRFNEYTHFINTNYGVFYTITGTYLPKTPFLYFNMERKMCSYIPGISKELTSMNFQLTNMYEEYHKLLECYLKNQRTLFYLTRMLPGLLTMQYSIYTHQLAERAWLSAFYVMESDSVANERRYFYTQPLLRKFKTHTMSMARMVRAMMDVYETDMSYDGIRGRYVELEFSRDHELTGEPIIVANACVLLVLMGSIMTDPIDVKSDEELGGVVHVEMETLMKSILEGGGGGGGSTSEDGEVSCAARLIDMYRDICEEDGHFKNKSAMWDRVWPYVFGEFRPDMKHYKDLFVFLSESFKFNENALRDFFSYTSAIYQPCRVQKHMNIYYGSPRCGKTTLLNIYTEMCNDDAIYRTSKEYKEVKSSGPSPNAIHLKTKYITIINEVSAISNNLLKTMTGDDGTNDDRTLFSTKFPMLSSCTFLVAACNHLPYMSMPDEAIRDRIVIFRFDMKATDLVKDPNYMLTYAENFTYKTQLYVSKMAPLLSNLLYVHFKYNRNEYGLVSPKCTNSVSQALLYEFMVKNNYLYNVLDMCNIRVVSSSQSNVTLSTGSLPSITEDELMSHVNVKLAEYNAAYNKTVSLNRYMKEFRMQFKQFYNETLNKYIGIGFEIDPNEQESSSSSAAANQTDDNDDENDGCGVGNGTSSSSSNKKDSDLWSDFGSLFKITPKPGMRVNVRKLRYEIGKQCPLLMSAKLSDFINGLKREYEYNADTNELLNITIQFTTTTTTVT